MPARATRVRLVTGPVQLYSSMYVRPVNTAMGGSQEAGGAAVARPTSTRPGGGGGENTTRGMRAANTRAPPMEA